MSCHPERITGYVDGALEPAERDAVEAHLADCPTCRQQVRAERELRERLGQLPPVPLPPEVERRIRGRLKARPRGRLWLLPLAASLALLLWARGWAPFVAWELARDHAHCFGRPSLPAEIWSEDPAPVIAWEAARGLAPPLLPASTGGLALIGGRRCPLLDRRVGHVYYGQEDHHLSLFVVPGPLRVNGSRSFALQGSHVRLLRVGGRNLGLVAEHAEDVDAFERYFSSSMASLE